MIFVKTTVALLFLLVVTAFDTCTSNVCLLKESLDGQMTNESYGVDIDKDGRSDFDFSVKFIETRDIGGSVTAIYSIRPANNGRLAHIKYVIPAFSNEPIITDSLRSLYEWSSSEFTLASRGSNELNRQAWTQLWGDGKTAYLIYELNYTNYGWIRLTVDTTNNSIKIHDYTYSFRCYK